MGTRQILALSAGMVWACAFPGIGVAGLGWIAPGLLLLSVIGLDHRQAFRLGYMAGLAHALIAFHWLLFIPFPMGAVMGWLALSAYLALYPAGWVWLTLRWLPSWPSPRTEEPWVLTASRRIGAGSLPMLVGWPIFCALSWVALEMIRGILFSGFPWNNLGASQFQILPLIQISAFTGVPGITFVMVWFSAALLCAILSWLNHPRSAGGLTMILLLPFSITAVIIMHGLRNTLVPGEPTRTLKIALIQPSIPQTLIWDPKEATNRFHKLIELSEAAMAAKPDLLVWPEAAVPNLVRYDMELTYPAITNLVRKHNLWLILGADDAEPSPEAKSKEDFDYFNSSFLITPAGEFRTAYRKQHLVIFGEYIPFQRWLPFLKWLAPIGEGFKPGRRMVPFSIPEIKVNTSVLICFEDIFADLAREAVQEDTDFLLNLTNNGWFGESAAQWQHAASAVFRAIENGLPLVRCANNGLTCWVDARGRMHEVYFGNSRDIYGAGFKIAEVPLRTEGELRRATFYSHHGDWFGWGCTGLTLIFSLYGGWRRRSGV